MSTDGGDATRQRLAPLCTRLWRRPLRSSPHTRSIVRRPSSFVLTLRTSVLPYWGTWARRPASRPCLKDSSVRLSERSSAVLDLSLVGATRLRRSGALTHRMHGCVARSSAPGAAARPPLPAAGPPPNAVPTHPSLRPRSAPAPPRAAQRPRAWPPSPPHTLAPPRRRSRPSCQLLRAAIKCSSWHRAAPLSWCRWHPLSSGRLEPRVVVVALPVATAVASRD